MALIAEAAPGLAAAWLLATVGDSKNKRVKRTDLNKASVPSICTSIIEGSSQKTLPLRSTSSLMYGAVLIHDFQMNRLLGMFAVLEKKQLTCKTKDDVVRSKFQLKHLTFDIDVSTFTDQALNGRQDKQLSDDPYFIVEMGLLPQLPEALFAKPTSADSELLLGLASDWPSPIDGDSPSSVMDQSLHGYDDGPAELDFQFNEDGDINEQIDVRSPVPGACDGGYEQDTIEPQTLQVTSEQGSPAGAVMAQQTRQRVKRTFAVMVDDDTIIPHEELVNNQLCYALNMHQAKRAKLRTSRQYFLPNEAAALVIGTPFQRAFFSNYNGGTTTMEQTTLNAPQTPQSVEIGRYRASSIASRASSVHDFPSITNTPTGHDGVAVDQDLDNVGDFDIGMDFSDDGGCWSGPVSPTGEPPVVDSADTQAQFENNIKDLYNLVDSTTESTFTNLFPPAFTAKKTAAEGFYLLLHLTSRGQITIKDTYDENDFIVSII